MSPSRKSVIYTLAIVIVLIGAGAYFLYIVFLKHTSISTTSSSNAVAVATSSPSSRILFSQPSFASIQGNFYVKQRGPQNKMYLIQWQSSPYSKNGLDVPVTWSVGDKTGFYPTGDLSQYQVGMGTSYGSTAVQAQGDTVGIYLNSSDLTNGSAQTKESIFPAIIFSPATTSFSSSQNMLEGHVDMQVATATVAKAAGSNSHIADDIQFEDSTSKHYVTIDVGLFYLNHPTIADAIVPDTVNSKQIIVAAGLRNGSTWVTILPGSNAEQGQTWTGYKPFSFAITYDEFKTMLLAVSKQYPSYDLSTNPADYQLTSDHINSEVHYAGGPATLGYSEKNFNLSLGDIHN